MDILQRLMQEVRKEMKAKRNSIALRGDAGHKSMYTEPTNWIEGDLFLLIHKETNEVLGTFREYTHRLSPSARRLMRVSDGGLAELLSDIPAKIVSGEHWLRPCPTSPPEIEYSPLDIEQMQARFFELMEGL